MENNTAYLSLGSNIDKETNIPKALQRLNEVFEILQTSKILLTEAIGPDGLKSNQDPFHNCAVEIRTPKSLNEIKETLRHIESEMGRVRTSNKFAPRPIDIDLVIYNDTIHDPDALKTPHNYLALREITTPKFQSDTL